MNKWALLVRQTVFAASLLCAQQAFALEVSGVKVDETVKVGNTELKLNGAGVRYKSLFKVYVAALYLQEPKTNVPDVLNATGPRRLVLSMLREVSSEAFGQSFMDGLNKNSNKAEKSKIIIQMQKFGEMFASIPELKKGDVVAIEWQPNVGSVCTLNGKRVGEVFPDIAFFNALLKIWLGDSPADASLKRAMLGEKPDSGVRQREN
ncbi:chalcone isomerase family protein [Massilia sp. W12]|uniref:chalcone isomerase family protein n=1 Tax=Massilia sp. W12 TaxID=3126507 RepID=UPI0030CD92D9